MQESEAEEDAGILRHFSGPMLNDLDRLLIAAGFLMRGEVLRTCKVDLSSRQGNHSRQRIRRGNR